MKTSVLPLVSSVQRLGESRLAVPHLVIAVTPDGRVVLRSNVSPDVLRTFGQDPIDVADELEAPPKPWRHDALIRTVDARTC